MAYPIQSPETQILSRSHIVSILDEKRVDWRKWRHTPGARTLEDLTKYHHDDQFYIRNGESPHFIIDVHVVVVRVHHKYLGVQLELYEDRQVFPDGHVERRGERFDGLGETRRRGESECEGAIRCLAEEVGFRDTNQYGLSQLLGRVVLPPTPSEKWPGVIAVYHRYIFECSISRKIFNLGGYIEKEEDGRTIYFAWRHRRQHELHFSA